MDAIKVDQSVFVQNGLMCEIDVDRIRFKCGHAFKKVQEEMTTKDLIPFCLIKLLIFCLYISRYLSVCCNDLKCICSCSNAKKREQCELHLFQPTKANEIVVCVGCTFVL